MALCDNARCWSTGSRDLKAASNWEGAHGAQGAQSDEQVKYHEICLKNGKALKMLNALMKIEHRHERLNH